MVGAGPPVLLIHAGVANLNMGDGQVEALRHRFRFIRFDTRGFGRTISEHVEFSNRRDPLAILDAACEQSAHVVGLSRGGTSRSISQSNIRIASARLTVAAGGVSGFQPTAESTVDWDEVESWEDAEDWERLTAFETAYWFDGPGQSADRGDPVARALVAEWIRTNHEAQPEYGIPQPLGPPADQSLDALTCPLLVLVGELDDVGTIEAMHHLAAAVPSSRLESLPTALMINLEQPSRFNELIAEHIDAATVWTLRCSPPTANFRRACIGADPTKGLPADDRVGSVQVVQQDRGRGASVREAAPVARPSRARHVSGP